MWLPRLIAPQVKGEQVRSTHPLVHGELGRNLGLLPRRQGRRTHDRFWGSAALNGFNLWVHRQTERLIAHIPQPEAGLDHSLELHQAEVDQLLVYLQSRSPWYWAAKVTEAVL